jgi:hypothetical protein
MTQNQVKLVPFHIDPGVESVAIDAKDRQNEIRASDKFWCQSVFLEKASVFRFIYFVFMEHELRPGGQVPGVH